MTWPSFVFPFGAWFFLALVPLIVLYFLRLRRPRQVISSLVLWQAVIDDQRVNAPFQRFRRNLLLLLQVLILCLLVMALMQPFFSEELDSGEYVPVLIDCSASMAAVGQDEQTSRLDRAKDQVRALFGTTNIALFSFASTGKRLTEFTRDEHLLQQALDRIQPVSLPGRLDDVLRVTAAYARTHPIDRVIVFTDGNLAETSPVELPFTLDVRRVDVGGPNAGITEFNARRTGPEDWDVFVRVAGSGQELLETKVQLYLDGRLTAEDTAEVAVDESERFVFPIQAHRPVLLEVRLVPQSEDSLAADNVAWLSLPEARDLRVRVSPNLFSWQHALQVLPRIDMDAGEQSKRAAYDLMICDSADRQGSEAPVTVYTGVIPDDLRDLLTIEEDFAEVVDWDRTAPILSHVRLSQVSIGQQVILASGADEGDLEERGYEVLVHGATGPLLLQKRQGLNVSCYFLFHTDRSTLPYRVAFPVLVSNVVETALKRASLSEVSAAPTGVLPPVAVEPNREYTVRTPTGERFQVTSTATGLLTGIPAAAVGRYDMLDGDDVVASVGTGLLSAQETSLAAVEEIRFSELSVATQEAAEPRPGTEQPLWWILAALAFVFLLAEWWYFQRPREAVG